MGLEEAGGRLVGWLAGRGGGGAGVGLGYSAVQVHRE